MQNMNNKTSFDFTKQIIIEVITPIVAPSISPNKFMKKMILEDLKRCYNEEIHELVEHLDKAFDRDAMCNAILSPSTISANLREKYKEYKDITIKGIIIVPKELIRIATKKAGNSLLNYEYIIAGARIQTTLKFSQDVKLPVLLQIGARRNKGYGLVRISEA